MKFRMNLLGCQLARSHPSRGAWIEISSDAIMAAESERRTPHGVRGLKYVINHYPTSGMTRSHPSRGAWIEMSGRANVGM